MPAGFHIPVSYTHLDVYKRQGRTRMYQALTMRQPKNVDIPSERTVYRVMEEIGISHHPRRKPVSYTHLHGTYAGRPPEISGMERRPVPQMG